MAGNTSWAFNQLNQLTPSPGVSPQNGIDALNRGVNDLSYPIDGSALSAQLEQWTSVSFDFDSSDFASPLDSHPKSHTISTEPLRLNGPRYSTALDANHYNFTSSDVTALNELMGNSSNEFVGASLIDPALHLPAGFHSAPAQTLQPELLSTSTPAYTPVSTLPSLVTSDTGLDSPASSSSSKTVKVNKLPSKKKAAKLATAGNPTTGQTVIVEREDSIPPLVLIEGDDEANALAIEEDKRRRNTAASARFRIKKKQREQALEITAKGLQTQVDSLQKEVEALRTENGWLKSLITEKPIKAEPELVGLGTRKRGRDENEA